MKTNGARTSVTNCREGVNIQHGEMQWISTRVNLHRVNLFNVKDDMVMIGKSEGLLEIRSPSS